MAIILPVTVANLLFWLAAGAVVVAQVMILRSTFRVLRAPPPEAAPGAPPRGRLLEWIFAIGPALALAALLALSWRATTMPVVMDIRW